MIDLEKYYRCLESNLQTLRNGCWSKPKASYMLTPVQRQDVCKWIQKLKIPDGYTSNLGKCVNVAQGKFFRHENSRLSCIYGVFATCCIERTA